MSDTMPSLAADDARTRLAEALVQTGEKDRTAFALVYRLTSAKLFGICLRICGERQIAEDVLQEVYALVWRRAGGFQPGRSSPITWLATIARNRAIDWRRANRRAPAGGLDDAALVADARPLADATMLRDENAQRLHGCIEGLDDAQRAAIRSAFFDGATYAELADREAVPLGTMKSRVRRGLMRLKECLGDDR